MLIEEGLFSKQMLHAISPVQKCTGDVTRKLIKFSQYDAIMLLLIFETQ